MQFNSYVQLIRLLTRKLVQPNYLTQNIPDHNLKPVCLFLNIGTNIWVVPALMMKETANKILSWEEAGSLDQLLLCLSMHRFLREFVIYVFSLRCLYKYIFHKMHCMP